MLYFISNDFGGFAVLLLLLIVCNIHIVQQSKAYVVEQMGAFRAVWNTGLHFKLPFVARIVKKVSLKEQVADFAPQPVITRDNVTMHIDTVFTTKSRTRSCIPTAWRIP